MSEFTVEVTAFKMSGQQGVVWVERATEVRGWRVQVDSLPGGGSPVPAVFTTGEDPGPAQHMAGLLLERVEAAWQLDRDLSDARAAVFDLAAELNTQQHRTALPR
jgi:hypothetical protein